MKIIGIILIAVGIVGLAYGGITWTHRKPVVDVGPVSVTHDETNSIPIPPVAGGICVVVGAILLATRSRAGRAA
jgi:uncharacterized membrane protein YidH (DUF202 family)